MKPEFAGRGGGDGVEADEAVTVTVTARFRQGGARGGRDAVAVVVVAGVGEGGRPMVGRGMAGRGGGPRWPGPLPTG